MQIQNKKYSNLAQNKNLNIFHLNRLINLSVWDWLCKKIPVKNSNLEFTEDFKRFFISLPFLLAFQYLGIKFYIEENNFQYVQLQSIDMFEQGSRLYYGQ